MESDHPDEAAESLPAWRNKERERFVMAPFLDGLTAAGIAWQAFSREDADRPRLPRAIAPDGKLAWRQIRTWQAVVPRGEIEALAAALGGHLEARLAREERIALWLDDGNAQIVTIPARDLPRAVPAMMQAGDRWEEHAPGGLLSTCGATVFSLSDAWLVQIYNERLNWRMRSAGVVERQRRG